MEHAALLNALGARIRMIRLTKNMTQNQLAEACDFEKSTMSKIESGQVNISYITLYRLCRGLKVGMSDLIDQNGHNGLDGVDGHAGHDGVASKR